MKRSPVTGRPMPTYEEQATNYELWEEYMDPDGVDTESDFNAMTIEEKLAMLVHCFGPEDEDGEKQ